MAKFTEANNQAWKRRVASGLNDQDKEIIKLICQEKTSTEIAEIIGRDKRTVDNSRKAIVEIIGCNNTAGVVIYAVKKKLFKV